MSIHSRSALRIPNFVLRFSSAESCVTMPDMDRHTIIDRAWRAYIASDGAGAPQPLASHSDEFFLNGLRYVTLGKEDRLLAVYRVRNNGRLRRMRRWPIYLSLHPELKGCTRDSSQKCAPNGAAHVV